MQALAVMARSRDRQSGRGPALPAVEAVLATRLRFTEALIDAGWLPPRAALQDLERDRLVLGLQLGHAALGLERDLLDLRRLPAQRHARAADCS